jgi:hypothetical protein
MYSFLTGWRLGLTPHELTRSEMNFNPASWHSEESGLDNQANEVTHIGVPPLTSDVQGKHPELISD